MGDSPLPTTGGGGFFASHPALTLGAGVTIALLLGAYLLNKKNTPATLATTTTGAASGLATDANGNPVVYVPTSTEFYTDNSNTATSAPGAPATINTSTNTSATTTTTTSSNVTTAPLHPPIVMPPSNHPPVYRKPPVTPAPSKGIHWTRGHHVGAGETLTSIAEQDTGIVRNQDHGPANFRVTAQQIYTQNHAVIDAKARAMGAKPPYADHIYPGTLLVVPEYR